MPVSPPRPISILDDDRLKPSARDQAAQLKTACLEIYETELYRDKRLTWESHFNHGTIPLLESGTTLFTDKDKMYKWLDDLVNQNDTLYSRSRFLLPWGIIKTAVGLILEVAYLHPDIHKVIIGTLECIIRDVPLLVKYAPKILDSWRYKTGNFLPFKDAMDLVFAHSMDFLTAVTKCLRGAAARNSTFSPNVSAAEIERARTKIMDDLTKPDYIQFTVQHKRAYAKYRIHENEFLEIRSRVSLYVVDQQRHLETRENDRSGTERFWFHEHPSILNPNGDLANNRLWLYGKPGVGKSVTVARLIRDRLKNAEYGDSDHIVLYFFCSTGQCTIQNILCSLIDQLCGSDLSGIYNFILNDLRPLFRHRNAVLPPGPFGNDQLKEFLIALLRSYTKVTIIIDGLDVCSEDTLNTLEGILDDILKRPTFSSRLKVLLSSRSTETLRYLLRDWAAVEVGGENTTQSDLRRHVNLQVTRMIEKIPSFGHSREELISTILARADSGFLYPVILADFVNACHDTSSLTVADLVASLPQELAGLYTWILGAYMKEGNEKDNQYRWMILQLLTYCTEPLPVTILIEMTGTPSDCRTPQEAQVWIEKLTGILVKIEVALDDETRVRLVHPTFSALLCELQDNENTLLTNLRHIDIFKWHGRLHVDYESSEPISEYLFDLWPPLLPFRQGELPDSKQCCSEDINPHYGQLLYWMLTALDKYTELTDVKKEHISYFINSIQPVISTQSAAAPFLRLLWTIHTTPGLPEHIASQASPYHYFMHFVADVWKTKTNRRDPSWPYILTYLYTMSTQGSTSTSEVRSRLKARFVDLCCSHRTIPRLVELRGVTMNPQEWLGSGGHAQVYKGSYENRVVALKRIVVVEKDEAQLRLYREGLMWWDLKHPNVVSLIGISRDLNNSDDYFLVMPLMKQGDIRAVLEKKLTDNSTSLELLQCQVHKWLMQISCGLAHIHERDVVHADLNGYNIMIDSTNNACITDFGISVVTTKVGPDTKSSRGGQPDWLAPEAHDLFRPKTPWDIYSFGCVCLELYTNEDPDIDIIKNVQMGPSESLLAPDFQGKLPMPDTLWQLMVTCWSISPRLRPTAYNLKTALSRIKECRGE